MEKTRWYDSRIFGIVEELWGSYYRIYIVSKERERSEKAKIKSAINTIKRLHSKASTVAQCKKVYDEAKIIKNRINKLIMQVGGKR